MVEKVGTRYIMDEGVIGGGGGRNIFGGTVGRGCKGREGELRQK